jgi:hypothetical protein
MDRRPRRRLTRMFMSPEVLLSLHAPAYPSLSPSHPLCSRGGSNTRDRPGHCAADTSGRSTARPLSTLQHPFEPSLLDRPRVSRNHSNSSTKKIGPSRNTDSSICKQTPTHVPRPSLAGGMLHLPSVPADAVTGYRYLPYRSNIFSDQSTRTCQHYCCTVRALFNSRKVPGAV